LTAQYNSTTGYRTELCWNKFLLGNNGGNELRAGQTATGGYFKFYTNNTANLAATANGILTMAMCTDGMVRTNIANNCGGLRSGNVTVGYGGSYNTVENIVSGQQLHLRTSNSANIKIGDSGSTCTFICNCVQSPIVCATNYIRIGAAGSYICQAGSGDLEIKSAGGDLDIVTWLRMRAGTNSTIKSSWSHSTGHMHIGGDTSNAAQDYAMKVSVAGSAGSICGAGCIRSASHIVSGTCFSAPVLCVTSRVVSADNMFVFERAILSSTPP
jgi:hypothetical protein